MDKSNRGSIQLIWSHAHYDACRSEKGFAGFRDEYATGYGFMDRGAGFNFAGNFANADTEMDAFTHDSAPVSGYAERITKRPKVTGVERADPNAATKGEEFFGLLVEGTGADEDTNANVRLQRGDVHCFMDPTHNRIANLSSLATTKEFQDAGIKLTSEINYPNFQRQEVPGMRGAQLTLKKIELQFSKKEHNVEWVDIDLNNLVGRGTETLSSHLHNNASANVIRLFSDGESRREVHLYNMYIGEAQDAQPEIGVRSVAYWPRHGMPCFGLGAGNDVYLCGGGSEYLRGQYRKRKVAGDSTTEDQAGYENFPEWIDGRSHGGGTNGVLLRVNILLERVST